jgi:hypothetical protein
MVELGGAEASCAARIRSRAAARAATPSWDASARRLLRRIDSRRCSSRRGFWYTGSPVGSLPSTNLLLTIGQAVANSAASKRAMRISRPSSIGSQPSNHW